MAETFEGAAAMGPVADTEETPPGIAPTAESKYRLLKTRVSVAFEGDTGVISHTQRVLR